MRLLIVTQKVDRNDPILGFFHRWIEEFAKHCEKVTVICLEKGEYNLPGDMKILSLGKETNVKHSVFNKFGYAFRFYKHIWQEKNNYDLIFVHMNQEYVLLGWKFWKLWGKKIYLWRNHAKGNFFTYVTVWLSDKVFCTSPHSFTARFQKTEIMPVGIDTDFFKPDPTVARIPYSILFLGRIAPVKKVLEFVEWFNKLDEKFHATVAGAALGKDNNYEKLVRSRASDRISFIGAVTLNEALKLYQSHETYVNMTPAGSFDKTILEAAACECALKIENPDFKTILENKNGKELRDFVVKNHSLKNCIEALSREMT